MLEYCHDNTLLFLEENELRRWLGVNSPHAYLRLVRIAKLLTHCPTTGLSHMPCDIRRSEIVAELGLLPTASIRDIWKCLLEHLTEPYPVDTCCYSFNGRDYTLEGDLTIRKVWKRLGTHSLFLIVTVDPITLQLHCRACRER